MQSYNRFKRFLAITLAAILVLSGLLTAVGPASTAQAAEGQVVISQVYGGGGNGGGVYTNDFIELYNPTSEPVDLTGWKVYYTSATRTSFDGASSTALEGEIPANGYYLIQQAAGANKELKDLPEPDAEGTLAMGGTNGVVGLADASNDIMDIVGYGTAVLNETRSTAALSNATAAIRKAEPTLEENNRGLDTNNNYEDFEVKTPDPRSSKYTQPVEDETQVAEVTANLASGEWPENTQITLATATEGATILVSVNGDEFKPYTDAITLTGQTTVTAYAQADGLKNSEHVTFTYDVVTVKPISEVRLYEKGKNAIVEGILTHKAGREMYIQDETGGIVLYDFDSSVANVGDKVRAGGEMEIYNNLQELKPLSLFPYEVIEENVGVPAAKVISPEQLSTENGESIEAQYVKLENVEIVTVNGQTVTAKSNEKEFIIYSNLERLKVGNKFEYIEGVVKQFRDQYQLIPLSDAALVENSFSVQATPASGKIIKGEKVALSSPTKGEIYYTLDKSDPTTASTKYVEPITITEDTTIKAIVVHNAEVSEIFTFEYIATEQPRIRDIQGATHTSPYNNQQVTDIEGIVTQLGYNFGNGAYKGFFIQDPQPDQDEKTSEGIFVYSTDASKAPKVGDLVKISGRVSEYNEGQSTNLTSTQITLSTIETISSDNALPEEIVLGKEGRLIPSETIDSDSFNVFNPEQDAIDFYESLEGMLVELPTPTIISPYWTSGSGNNLTYNIPTRIENDGTDLISPLGGLVLKESNNLNPQRLLLAYSNPGVEVNTGDKFEQDITGVIGYNNGNFKVIPAQNALPKITPANHAQEVTHIEPVEDKLTVAAYNILNYSPKVGEEKINKLAESFATNLKSPDIIAVVEMQDANGDTDNGVVEADASQLIQAIKDKGGVEYSYVEIAPANNQDGGQPGANIRVGFLYNEDRVQLAQSTTGKKGTVTEAVTYNADVDQLTHNPGLIDPTNKDLASTRKPIAAQFEFNGEKVIVIGAHFNSKSGDQGPFGISQPASRDSEIQREKISTIVNGFVKDVVLKNEDANVVVLGDLNDFQFSKSVEVLKGQELDNLVDELPANDRYTYTFDGNSQVLDHILVSKNLTEKAVVDAVRLNADFSESAGRVSDHDPILAQLDFTESLPSPSPSPSPGPSPGPSPTPTPTPNPDPTPSPTPAPTPTLDTYVNGQAPVTLFNNLLQLVNGNGPMPTVEFTDLDHWAQETIEIFASLNLVNGYADGSFKPNGDITRAEFVSIIVRAFGISSTPNTSSFNDVPENAWYANAVNTAHAAGIIKGTGNGDFNPDASMSRQDILVILSRLVNFEKFSNANPTIVDFDQTSDYAKAAVQNALNAGVLKGKGNGMIDALSSATRAEAIQLILESVKLDPVIKALLEALLAK